MTLFCLYDIILLNKTLTIMSSHSHHTVLPRPIDLGITSLVLGILMCTGIGFLLNIWLPWYFSAPLTITYFALGIVYPGALFGRSLIILEKVSFKYFYKGIGWNPLWFLQMVIRLDEPRDMSRRQIELTQKYVCKENYEMSFKGVLVTSTVNPACISKSGGQHQVDHQLQEVIEAAARPYIAAREGLKLWQGIVDEHTKTLEEEIEEHIRGTAGYDHNDMVLAELGQEIEHVIVALLEPTQNIKDKHEKVHGESIERESDLADIGTVEAVVKSLMESLPEGHNLDAKFALDRVLAIRGDATVAVQEHNINLTLDENSKALIDGLDPKTKAAIMAFIAAQKGKTK